MKKLCALLVTGLYKKEISTTCCVYDIKISFLSGMFDVCISDIAETEHWLIANNIW